MKRVRDIIADANGIEKSSRICMNKGECAGTCPLCEKELLDLIQFISKRSFQTYYRDALSWGNWWLSRGKFLTLQLNPAMRGASEEEHTGYWVVRLHTERRLLTLYFLAIRNLRNFEFATKDEAIVDAPWVRLCASYYGIAAVLRGQPQKVVEMLKNYSNEKLFSCSNKNSFLSNPPEKPVIEWLLPMTRWQGIIMQIPLAPIACATALTLLSLPIIFAISE